MRKFSKLPFALGCLILLGVSLPVDVCGQIILGPDFGVRIGSRTFGTRTEVEYRLQEVPITTGNSGRMNAIAINPTERREILVTSESGGLFKSTNGGARWTHIDGLPPHDTRDVAYLPSDPRFVFVTAFDDFRTPSGAGVWRLDDTGRWQQPPTSVLPVGGRCASRASGFGITIEPGTERIYVATSCGILKSSDRGVTWSRIDRPRPGREGDWPSAAFYSVVALGDGKVIAAGRAGVWYSEDGGETWRRAAFPTGNEALNKEEGHHALSASPVSRDHAYIVTGTDGAYKLFYTTTAGQRWDRIPSPAGIGWAGGNPFVKVGLVPGSGDIDVYFSEGIELHKLRAIRTAGPTPSFDYVSRPCLVPPGCYQPSVCQGGWRIFYLTGEDRNHGDARDVALQDGFQLFLANDGGLEKWNAAERCPRFQSIGGGRDGLNAWQLNSVTGQKIESPLGQYIYVGSHDNGILASANRGFSWLASDAAEGATIQLERQVARRSDSVVTWTDAGVNVGKFIGGALFAGKRPWPAPRDSATGARIGMNGDPLLLKRGVYMQYGRDLGTTFEEWLTKTAGASWESPLILTRQPAEDFTIAGPPDDPVIYQPTLMPADTDGRQIFWFTKLTNVLTDPFRSATVSEPLMETDDGHFGGLGVNQTWERYYNCPFAVDPGNPDRLIAPDAIRGGMKLSVDGGNMWTDMPQLTDLVTHRGALRFSKPVGVSESSRLSGLLLTLVSEISFCPDYPDYVLIGTQEGGLYYSKLGGGDGTWFKIPNSDQIKPVSGFYWESPTSVYISTHGRGLWHLSIVARTTVEPGDLEPIEWCPSPCFLDLRAGPEPDPRPRDIDEAVLVMNGSVNDAMIENGLLKSFAITPGATAISLVSKQTNRSNLLPIYADRIGQFVGLPRAAELTRQQKVIRGFTFKNGVVKHLVYGDTIVRLEPSPRNPSKIRPKQTPVVDNRPYISVQGKKMMGGMPVLHGPGELEVFGRNFAKGRNNPIGIRVDNKVVAQGIVTDQQGHFSAIIKVNAGMGVHGIQVSQRLATGKRLQDARVFVVRPLDR